MRHGRERDVRRDVRGVEVDRVRDRAAVDELDVHHVALAHVDHGTGRGPVERPAGVVDAGRDGEDAILERDRVVVQGAGCELREAGREGVVRGRKRSRVRGNDDRVRSRRSGRARGCHSGHRRHCAVLGHGRRDGAARAIPAAHRHEPDGEGDEHGEAGERDRKRDRAPAGDRGDAVGDRCWCCATHLGQPFRSFRPMLRL